MVVDLALIAAGLVLLVAGGEFLVRGAVALALRLGITPLVVGLTVVAFGTSAPEMIVSVSAALKGATDLAMGNVVGSNIANVLVILGVSALIAPIVTRGHDLRESWWMMVGASVLLIALALIGPLGLVAGLVLLAGLGMTLWRQLSTAGADDTDLPEGTGLAPWRNVAIWLAIGLISLPIGAHLLVQGATDIARAFGVSEAVIGLTLVAVGTSLPELAASVMAALRGRSDLALGNVVGSNIFNILCILGITALIKPMPVPEQMLRLDFWVMLAAALILWPFLFRGQTIGRAAGVAMVAAYAAYVVVLLK
ncbi:MAG: calcium/sodium antiporter [Paracoccus sp. (in: a-proteobacteria)]|uniref:calcium/sodium antiporter n=1 Tax=Paracoccus sp. TaxID=267 RepID=UPI0026DF7E12|nr:calcium/sodium antiporter [Paracoccus sp. (in: a-proteobacteria)]MDO5620033.1 calcium/sodium antiporter [Paracoccus sp. (in: a-proteobacteria)]